LTLKPEYPAVFFDEDKADEYVKEHNTGQLVHGYIDSNLMDEEK